MIKIILYCYKRFKKNPVQMFLLIKNTENSVYIKNIKQQKHVFNIANNKNFIQHIKMISEGSCDTEDWSNDTENSALITAMNYIFLYIFKYKSYFNCNIISQ